MIIEKFIELSEKIVGICRNEGMDDGINTLVYNTIDVYMTHTHNGAVTYSINGDKKIDIDLNSEEYTIPFGITEADLLETYNKIVPIVSVL